MKIVLDIDESKFPILATIKTKNLNKLSLDIFSLGYEQMFPKTDTTLTQLGNPEIKQLIDTYGFHTDLIKYDLLKMKRTLEKNDMNEKIEKFSNIMEELVGAVSNSAKKGKLSENLVFNYINNRFPEYSLEETRHTPHSGDAILTIPSQLKNIKIMIEIKNYSKPVDREEVEKLIYDMKFKRIRFAIIMSLRSTFIGKKYLAFEEFNYSNEKYIILYVPLVGTDVYKIDCSILLMKRIIKLENTGLNESLISKEYIYNELKNLDSLITNISNMKQNYKKMENSIKDNLSNYFTLIRDFESDLKNKIEKLMLHIEDKVKEPNICLDNGPKNLKIISEVFTRNNWILKKKNNLYEVQDESKNLRGFIIIKKNKCLLDLNNPNIYLEFLNSNYKKELIQLEEYFN